jgi:L-cysteine S-thiosulfotransferase
MLLKLILRLVPGTLALAMTGGCAPFASDRIETPLVSSVNVLRGEQLGRSRQGTCVLCHKIEADSQGSDIAPPLQGVGLRWDAAQLRARLVDAQAVSPGTIMPSYFTTRHLVRVDPAYRDKPVLQAQQIEDLIAWLITLR